MALLNNRLILLPSVFRVCYPAVFQVRNIRGKGPEEAKTLKQRLDDMAGNERDPSLHFAVNIGLPHLKPKRSEEFKRRTEEMKAQEGKTFSVEETLQRVNTEWKRSCGPFHIKSFAEHFNIFQDLFGDAYFVPRVMLDIKYKLKDDSLMQVYYGNQIKPSEASTPPSVTYEANPSSLWSLILTNPDGHFTEPDAEYVHWFIGNIPGSDIAKGQEIINYLQPFPPRGTGSQRLIFVLYKQEKIIDFSSFKRQSPCLDLSHRTFRTRKFYESLQDLITPAGLAFFQSDWDSSLTDFFHNTLSMQEPIYEYDFPEPYVRPQRWFPKREPFNLYMDKHRDPKQIAKELLLKRLKQVDPFVPKKPDFKFPNALPEDNKLPSWLRVEIRKQRLKWGRYSDM